MWFGRGLQAIHPFCHGNAAFELQSTDIDMATDLSCLARRFQAGFRSIGAGGASCEQSRIIWAYFDSCPRPLTVLV